MKAKEIPFLEIKLYDEEGNEIITEDVVTTINVEITPPLSPQEEAEALEMAKQNGMVHE